MSDTTTIDIKFEPLLKELNYNALFGEPHIALERYKYIYNQLVKSMISFDMEKSKAFQEFLRDIIILAQAQWSKINFNHIHGEKIIENK